jgi:hypothetical protein
MHKLKHFPRDALLTWAPHRRRYIRSFFAPRDHQGHPECGHPFRVGSVVTALPSQAVKLVQLVARGAA